MRILHRTVAVASLFVAVAGASFVVTQTAQPAQAATVSHRCYNPNNGSGGVRAGLCATLDAAGSLLGFGEAFCQKNSTPFTTVKCDGIEVGADLYRRTVNGSWVMVRHGVNVACGTRQPGYSCPGNDRLTSTTGSYGYGGPTCYHFKVGARATVVLPNGTSISNMRYETSAWANPACSA